MLAVVAPRDVSVTARPARRRSSANVWPGQVGAVDLLGDRVRVRVDGTPAITAEVTPAAVDALNLDAGGQLWASVPPRPSSPTPRDPAPRRCHPAIAASPRPPDRHGRFNFDFDRRPQTMTYSPHGYDRNEVKDVTIKRMPEVCEGRQGLAANQSRNRQGADKNGTERA